MEIDYNDEHKKFCMAKNYPYVNPVNCNCDECKDLGKLRDAQPYQPCPFHPEKKFKFCQCREDVKKYNLTPKNFKVEVIS